MRRIAAAFSKRDKNAKTSSTLAPLDTSHPLVKKKSGLFNRSRDNEPEPASLSPLPDLVRPGLSTPSSSSSSDGSSSIRTPVDDALLDFSPALTPDAEPVSSRKWPTWISRRRRHTLDPKEPSSDISGNVLPPSPLPSPLSPPHRTLPPVIVENADDTDEDESDAYSSSSCPSLRVSASAPPLTRVTDPGRALSNLRLVIQSGLDSASSASHPLLNSSGTSFPRSCNTTRTIPPATALRPTLHRTRLLRRIDERSLTPSEQASILVFANRSGSHHARHATRRADEEAVLDRRKLVGHSRGVRSWLKRPTFEARMVEWRPAGDRVECVPVSGGSLAVAELEFSDALHALAGPHDSSPSGSAVGPPSGRSSPPPLDLREFGLQSTTKNRRSLPPPAKPVIVLPAKDRPKASTLPPKASISPRKGDEDDLPLGLVLKTRRDREERERQLREEQERRAKEEQRRREEEERAKKAYQDEVLAARMRRERYRSGTFKGNPFDVDARERDQARVDGYSASSRREASDPSKTPPLSSGSFLAPLPRSESSRPRPPSVSGSARTSRTDLSKTTSRPAPATASSRGSLYASSAAGDSRQSLSTRRSASEITARTRSNSEQQRTLPRSFKPSAEAPPVPALARNSTLTRARSQPQVPMYPVAPVYMMPVMPVAYAPLPNAGARQPILDPRLSWSTDRLSMFMPPQPVAHIQ